MTTPPNSPSTALIRSQRAPHNRRRFRTAMPYIVLVACLPLLASRSDCDTRAGGLTCATVDVIVLPGECVPIANPCGGQWLIQDGFKLCDEPSGLSIQSIRSRGTHNRELCAAAGTPLLSNEVVAFLYSTADDFGEGNFNVTVTFPLSVQASASPQTVTPGGSSELDAVATGGTGTYTYDWTPAGSLTSSTLQDPIAFPVTTTDYTVTVTDSGGNTANDSVTVTVAADLVVTANPTLIPRGGSSQLNAALSGAVPPITYSWSPATTLSSATVRNPFAAPAATTTYQVTVTDLNGSTTGSVLVSVELGASTSATPQNIAPGESSQLLAVVSGGRPPYSFQWNSPLGAASLDDPLSASPVATPTETTTYTVTVTDLFGESVDRNVTVDVTGPTPLDACFTVSPDPPPAVGTAVFDFSCSSGAITLYEFWRAWSGNPAQPPDYVGTLDFFQAGIEFFGCADARLRVSESSGAADEEIVNLCYQ